ncbi:MAG: efflux RND transporter periplasmic adaptor subunit, partial [Verrucomicrobiota bacterium]
MKRFAKYFFGLGILGFGLAVTALLWVTRPEAEKKQEATAVPVVEYLTIARGEEIFEIPSQGIIQPDKRTQIASEVGGRVVEVSPQFKPGKKFSEGEILVRLDPTDYEAAVAQAASTLADAESSLASEKARADQAMRDWKRLGNPGEPSSLVARKPQLKSAHARVESARAALAKAQNDLERTKIRSPYDAIVATTSTELGSYLAPTSPVAEVYAVAPFEVRLPLSVDQAAFLPSHSTGAIDATATLRATAAGRTRRWSALIERSEGEIDRATRSLYLVAKGGTPIDPSGIEIRPGLYVDASIPSRALPDVAKVPFRAFRNLDEVVLINQEDEIEFRRVNVLHRQGEDVFVGGGLEEGERVCLTELPDLVTGMKVEPVPANQSQDDLTESTAN